jgi:hypothetical protein
MLSEVLKALGIFLILLVVLIFAGIIWLKYRLKWRGDRLELAPVAPVRIHLASSPNRKFRKEAAQLISEFQARGLEDIGSFGIKEISGLYIKAFFEPEMNAYAIAYDHPKIGAYSDICVYYAGEGSLVVSNSPLAGILDQRPGYDKIVKKEATVPQLFELLLKNKKNEPVRELSGNTFVKDFEDAYAEDIDWRLARGGPSDDEIRRIAATMDEPTSEEAITEAKKHLKAITALQLTQVCIENYLNESGMTDQEWAKIGDRALIIHDRMEKEQAVEYLSEYADSKEVDFEYLLDQVHMSPRDSFRHGNNKLSDSMKFKLLGMVKAPIEADIYISAE